MDESSDARIVEEITNNILEKYGINFTNDVTNQAMLDDSHTDNEISLNQVPHPPIPYYNTQNTFHPSNSSANNPNPIKSEARKISYHFGGSNSMKQLHHRKSEVPKQQFSRDPFLQATGKNPQNESSKEPRNVHRNLYQFPSELKFYDEAAQRQNVIFEKYAKKEKKNDEKFLLKKKRGSRFRGGSIVHSQNLHSLAMNQDRQGSGDSGQIQFAPMQANFNNNSNGSTNNNINANLPNPRFGHSTSFSQFATTQNPTSSPSNSRRPSNKPIQQFTHPTPLPPNPNPKKRSTMYEFQNPPPDPQNHHRNTAINILIVNDLNSNLPGNHAIPKPRNKTLRDNQKFISDLFQGQDSKKKIALSSLVNNFSHKEISERKIFDFTNMRETNPVQHAEDGEMNG
jgi:hypothetical protein